MLLINAQRIIIAITRRFSQLPGYEKTDLLKRTLSILKQGFKEEDEFTKKQIINFKIYHLQYAESKALVVHLLHKKGHAVPVRLRSCAERGPNSRLREILLFQG